MIETSYGIVPLRLEGGTWKAFLVQHVNGAFWGFPKGHSTPGEAPVESAKRELREETGIEVERMLQISPLKESYSFSRDGVQVRKQVYFYPAMVNDTVTLDKKEILDGKWVAIDNLEQEISFPEGKKIAGALVSELKSLPVT